MKKLIVVLVIIIIAAGAWWYFGFGNRNITNARPTGTSIIAFGDSLTAGVGASSGMSYPEQLAARINRPILNMGVPGDKASDALARLQNDVLNQDPRIVLLLIGGNDLLQKTPPDTAFADMEKIITAIQSKGALVIVIGLSGSILNPSYGPRYKSLAKKYGCPYIPNALKGIIGNRGLMHDQIHPNTEGYTKMVDRIEPVLSKYL